MTQEGYQEVPHNIPHNRIFIEDLDRSFRLRTTSALDELDLHCALIRGIRNRVDYELRMRLT